MGGGGEEEVKQNKYNRIQATAGEREREVFGRCQTERERTFTTIPPRSREERKEEGSEWMAGGGMIETMLAESGREGKGVVL